MENAAYVALSRQMTLRRQLDVVANNIANANTTGFKVEQLMVETEIGAKARNDAIRPGASFVLDRGLGRDFGQGALQQTGRSLDFAVDGEGAFFKIADATGEAYTRDGAFTVDPTGKLVTKAGDAVQGDGGDIILDPKLGEVSVAQDGTISQNGQLVGRLSLVRFDALGALSKDGDGLYRNRSNAAPIEATGVQIRQGMLEGSNVNSLTQITDMIKISRAYEQATKIVEQTHDMSRRSVERLGRVS